jgi:hypothetical protein
VRVAADEAFVLVAWRTVMGRPFVSQLHSFTLLVLIDPHALSAPVKPGKSRQIVANETADGRTSDQARSINGRLAVLGAAVVTAYY